MKIGDRVAKTAISFLLSASEITKPHSIKIINKRLKERMEIGEQGAVFFY